MPGVELRGACRKAPESAFHPPTGGFGGATSSRWTRPRRLGTSKKAPSRMPRDPRVGNGSIPGTSHVRRVSDATPRSFAESGGPTDVPTTGSSSAVSPCEASSGCLRPRDRLAVWLLHPLEIADFRGILAVRRGGRGNRPGCPTGTRITHDLWSLPRATTLQLRSEGG